MKMPEVKSQPHPKEKPHYKGLTVKQQNFVDEVVRQIKEEGKLNVKEATLKTYEAKPSSAAAMGHENLTKPYIRDAYLAELEAQGVTDELAAKAVRGAMKAEQRQRNYETGEVYYEPDHRTRLKAAKEYHKLRGVYPDKTVRVDKRIAKFDLYTDMNITELQRRLKTVEGEISKLENDYSV